MKQTDKPPRLSDKEIADIKSQVSSIGYHYTQSYIVEVVGRVAQAQRDADYDWELKLVEQVRTEVLKTERQAIQDLYQTIDGDIVIPKDDWQALPGTMPEKEKGERC